MLDEAPDIVAGAGLLRRNGAILQDWSSEGLSLDEFTHARHPRTMIGVDRAGYIWLAVIDGRQPSYSVGMTFEDLQRLCDRLAIIHRGQILTEGCLEDLRAQHNEPDLEELFFRLISNHEVPKSEFQVSGSPAGLLQLKT